MLVYRLCKQRYSAGVLSGAGGLQADGRWHTLGKPIVYCATSESLAVLELRVHVGNWLPRDAFAMHEIEIANKNVTALKTPLLPDGWNAVPHTQASQQLGDAWLTKNQALALRVPSIHSSTEFNVLINPMHPKHKEVKVKRMWQYRFDARMFESVK
jgi:RES domain-containing protein